MTQFEFLSVFISIVLALGVSGILSGWGDQIRFREMVKQYFLHTVWSILYLLIAIQAWWGLWRVSDRTEWTFFDNLLFIFPFLLLALLAYVLTPSISNGQRDIKAYYYGNAQWIFGIGAIYIVVQIFNTNNVLDMSLIDPANSIRFLAIAILVLLAVWRNEIFHKVAAAASYILLTAWIASTYFAL
jgi:hypothetical protein